LDGTRSKILITCLTTSFSLVLLLSPLASCSDEI
jgi:hypothetical protein